MANGKKSKVRIDELMDNGHSEAPASVKSPMTDNGDYGFDDKLNKNYFRGMYLHFRQNLGRYAVGIGAAAAIAALYLGPMGGYDKIKTELLKRDAQNTIIDISSNKNGDYKSKCDYLLEKLEGKKGLEAELGQLKDSCKIVYAKHATQMKEKENKITRDAKIKMDREFEIKKNEMLRKYLGVDLKFAAEYNIEKTEKIKYDFVDNRNGEYFYLELKSKNTGRKVPFEEDQQNPARQVAVENYSFNLEGILPEVKRKQIIEGDIEQVILKKAEGKYYLKITQSGGSVYSRELRTNEVEGINAKLNAEESN